MKLVEERRLHTNHGALPVEIYTKPKQNSSATFHKGTLRIYLSNRLRGKAQNETIDYFLQWGKKNVPRLQSKIPLETLLFNSSHCTTVDGLVRPIQWKWTTRRTPQFLISEETISIHLPRTLKLRGASALYPNPNKLTPEEKTKVFRSFLKILGQEYFEFIENRLRELHETHLPRKKLRNITLSFQRTRWGTCSSQGDIMINPVLLLLHPNLLDYVIIHELCHLRHMDHSPAFWDLVHQIYPRYTQAKRSLDQYE